MGHSLQLRGRVGGGGLDNLLMSMLGSAEGFGVEVSKHPVRDINHCAHGTL
jgi:hypothetical protein